MTDTKKQLSIVEYMSQEAVSGNIKETLGRKSNQFIASVAALVNSNELLAQVDKKSVLLACLTAASLDLPINQNLGFAYIIPYKGQAQFQLGYRGFIQLAMRSGQFQTINVSDVRQDEIVGTNRLTGEMTFSWIETDRESNPVVGYVGYIKLINGFEKSLYMTVSELQAHGVKYSQSAKRGFGLWKEDFDAMAQKTIIKLLLAKYAPMTVDMQRATLADQAIILDEDRYSYIDNVPEDPTTIAQEKEFTRLSEFIAKADTLAKLQTCNEAVEYHPDTRLRDLYDERYSILANLPIDNTIQK